MRVVIDTDPGIDDAIAILFALLHPGIEVAALTTVGGNIGLAATTRNAGRVLALLGRGVPVHPGAAAPLRRPARHETAVHGADGLGGVPFPAPLVAPSPEGAVEAMAALVGDGVTTLLTLGPLTNLAHLLERAPEAAARLTRVIAMGGAVDGPGNVGPRAEFNIAHDPDAAAIVLAAGLPLTLVPLDATRQLRADRAYVEALAALGTPAGRAASHLIDAYFASTTGPESRPLHDPCVPLLLAHPERFTLETRRLAVDLADGALVPGPHPVRVATGLAAPPLLAALRETLGAR